MRTVHTPQCVAPVGDACGEGVVWDSGSNSVYWCDINRFLIHRYCVASCETRSWFFDEPVVALSLTTRPGTLVVALASRLILWKPGSDQRQDHGFRLDGYPAVRLNDGRTDPAGRFWVGSMRNNVGRHGEALAAGGRDGVLFRIDGPDRSTIAVRDIGISNTLCWSPDDKVFYFADTLANTIYAFDYDKDTGTITNRRIFFEKFERGLPDGSAIDSEGYLWNCRYGGGCVVRIAPDGRAVEVVEMPALNVTTCAFGDVQLRKLYICTASNNRASSDRLAGSLFEVELQVAGRPSALMRLS